MVILSKLQRKAVYRAYMRFSHPDCFKPLKKSYRDFRRENISPMLGGGGAVVVDTEHNLWLAVEPDGYTHS